MMNGSRAAKAQRPFLNHAALHRVAFRERRPYGTLKSTHAICHTDMTGKKMPAAKLEIMAPIFSQQYYGRMEFHNQTLLPWFQLVDTGHESTR